MRSFSRTCKTVVAPRRDLPGPKLLSFYQYVGRYLEEKLGLSTRMTVGSSYDELPGRIDLAFICGLPYVELERTKGPMFEPIAAPVVQGERYGGRPIYFSDVIVQRNSSYEAFADLRGAPGRLTSRSRIPVTGSHGSTSSITAKPAVTSAK